MEGYWEIDETQAQVVRDVFDRYVNGGVSIGELARWLTERGVQTKTGKTRWDARRSGHAAHPTTRAGRVGRRRPPSAPAPDADTRRAASGTAAGSPATTSRPRTGR